jgi:hypothetical protein
MARLSLSSKTGKDFGRDRATSFWIQKHASFAVPAIPDSTKKPFEICLVPMERNVFVADKERPTPVNRSNR